MSKFLGVHFDRYDAAKSVNTQIESVDSKEAFIKVNNIIHSHLDDDCLSEQFDQMITKVNDFYSCVNGDEDWDSDWLIYNLDVDLTTN